MKATIMIPAYNTESFLEETLESAISQTYPNDYEVLIVNDGSSDNTRKISEVYQRKHSNIRLLNQENQGIGITRNRLLDESKGEILLGLDADDKLHPKALEKVVNCFNNYPEVSFVYTNQNEINEKNEFLRTRKRDELNSFFPDLIYHCHFLGHLRSFRKIHLTGFRFDSNLKTAEDWDFILKILPFVKTAHIPKPLYDYRINENGISLTNGQRTILTSIDLVEKYLKKRKIYQDRKVKIVPIDAGNNIIYYDHLIDGKSTMKPEAREILLNYLRR